ASIASPAAAGSIQIAVCRHDYGHASVADAQIATSALPTASVRILPRMLRPLARCCRDGQPSADSKSQQYIGPFHRNLPRDCHPMLRATGLHVRTLTTVAVCVHQRTDAGDGVGEDA